jgi:alkylhydroperoxidase/carboxymuconolactone decarboxylase family protein YurZ
MSLSDSPSDERYEKVLAEEQIVEFLIHTAAYRGVPRTGAACRSALQVLSETP